MTFLLLISGYILKGQVSDQSGSPLAWASVIVEGTYWGTSTNENGIFGIEIPDSMEHGYLIISLIGFKEKKLVFYKNSGFIRVKLLPEIIEIKGVEVTADYSLSETEELSSDKTTLNQMDIYTTPGTAADIFLTLKALPGFSGDADLSKVAIRGGSPQEVLITINGLPIKHPYLYYESTGGLFSIIHEGSIQRAEAFTGPLPPQYGGKMSGGVLLATRSSFHPSLSLGISMGAFDISATQPLFGGIWFTKSYYDLLASILNQSSEYAIYPSFWTLQWSKSVQLANFYLKPFAIFSHSYSELNLEDMGYDKMFDDAQNKISGFAGGAIVDKWEIEVITGFTNYLSKFEIKPIFGKHIQEKSLYSKASIIYKTSSSSALIGGAEIGSIKTLIDGYFQNSHYDFFNFIDEAIQSAIFAAHKLCIKKINLMYGLHPVIYNGNFASFDPRCLMEFNLNEFSKMHISLGRMSQFPSMNDTVFNYADHITIGMEKNLSFGTLKLDAYYKHYRTDWNSLGTEFLHIFTFKNLKSWAGFSIMKTKTQNGSPLDYDIPVRLTMIFNLPFNSWMVGFNTQWAVGKPYTPIIGMMDSAGVKVPIWGEKNSARLPNTFRLDCRFTHLFRVLKYPVIFYLEGYNITNHKNVVNYSYSRNYEKKRAIVFFPRMVYAGILLSLL